jgi:hypothetical protein
MSIKHVYLLTVVAAFACASTASKEPPRAGQSSSGTLLTSMDLAESHADVNSAYDAVARLRPNWLAPHGVTSVQGGGSSTEYAVVFVDGQLYGDINTLRNIPAYNVRAMRYYDVTQAGARFGIRGGSSGAIEVTTR